MFLPAPHASAYPFAHSPPPFAHALGPQARAGHVRPIRPNGTPYPSAPYAGEAYRPASEALWGRGEAQAQIRPKANGMRNPWAPHGGESYRPATSLDGMWEREAEAALSLALASGRAGSPALGSGSPSAAGAARTSVLAQSHSHRAVHPAVPVPMPMPTPMAHSPGTTARRHVHPNGSVASSGSFAGSYSGVSARAGGPAATALGRADDGWLGSAGRAHRGFEPDLLSVAGALPGPSPGLGLAHSLGGRSSVSPLVAPAEVPMPIPQYGGSRRGSIGVGRIPIGGTAHLDERLFSSRNSIGSRHSSGHGSPRAHSPQRVPSVTDGSRSGLHKRSSMR